MAFAIWFLFMGILAHAQALTSDQIDSLAEKALATFEVPGMAVAIIKDGKVVNANGYGVRLLKSDQKVNEYTLFAVASNTKAFTATAIGMLIDEKKLTWDTKVIKIITEFKMHDPFVTKEFTVRHLLTHRTGLGLGSEDLKIWPDSSTVTKKQIIYNLCYLKPTSSFRAKFDYDYLLYIVAGEVMARVSGTTWEDFIENRIMQPLGMTESATSFNRLKDKSNIIDAHAPVNGKVSVVIPKDFSTVSNAAGGINTNVIDLGKWVLAQLNEGKYGEGLSKVLFSKRTQKNMLTLQTVIPGVTFPYNTHFFGYGLGWFLSDVKGYLQTEHTGGLAGMVSEVTLIPELKLGIIVLTNEQRGEAFTAKTNSIQDGYFDVKKKDWIKMLNEDSLAEQKEAKETVEKVCTEINLNQKSSSIKLNQKNYLGTFTDVWFGNVTNSETNGKIYFKAKKSPKLQGNLTYFKDNIFIVKWNDRSMDADAYVKFNLDKNAKANGFKMEPVSPLTDFSFNFQDLDLKKKQINN